MKNMISMLFLIASVALIIASCKKDEESDDSSSSVSTGTGTTASGTIEGNSDLSGTFN